MGERVSTGWPALKRASLALALCGALAGCGDTGTEDKGTGGVGGSAGMGGVGVGPLCSGVDCDDGSECTTDTCDPMDGLCDYVNVADGTSCDFDGLPGVCGEGSCRDAMLCAGVDCNDDEDCTTDTCDPLDGLCDYVHVVDGTTCDFAGLPGVYGGGACEDAMLCAGVDCDDGNECTTDSCDPTTGLCANTVVIDGTACDFGGLPGVCGAGSCEDAMLCAGVDCDDGNECTTQTCDPQDGLCDYANVADDTACDFGGLPGVGECPGIAKPNARTAVCIQSTSVTSATRSNELKCFIPTLAPSQAAAAE